LAQLQAQWLQLKARSDAMLDNDIPALNRKLWDLGIGAILGTMPLRIVP
jgi:hypothetical protein